jgi:hypothetical protein
LTSKKIEGRGARLAVFATQGEEVAASVCRNATASPSIVKDCARILRSAATTQTMLPAQSVACRDYR